VPESLWMNGFQFAIRIGKVFVRGETNRDFDAFVNQK